MTSTINCDAPSALALLTGSAMRSRKLGAGWKWIGSSVWEHPNGTRIHGLGRARWPNGASRMWTWQEEYAAKKLMGYNTKRALMAWALAVLSLQNTKITNSGA